MGFSGGEDLGGSNNNNAAAVVGGSGGGVGTTSVNLVMNEGFDDEDNSAAQYGIVDGGYARGANGSVHRP